MNRKRSIITGVLFIICTLTGVISVAILGNIVNATTLFVALDNSNLFITGALLILIMAFTGTGIGISIYPVLKDKYPSLAIGSVVFRTIEGAIISIGSIIYISIFALHNADLLTNELAEVLLVIRPFFPSYSGAIAFSLGATLYYIAFYKSKLVPRWLSAWGFVGAVLHMIAIVFVAFGHDPFAPYLMVLHIPIGVQEMVFAVWLIVKGYRE